MIVVYALIPLREGIKETTALSRLAKDIYFLEAQEPWASATMASYLFIQLLTNTQIE